MNEKNFVKSFVKKVDFNNGGSIINASINVEDLNRLPKDKYGNVKVSICSKREPDQYGNTHYIIENTYKPKGDGNSFNKKDDVDEEDIPF